MEPAMAFADLLLLITATQGLLLSLVLATHSQRSKRFYLLSLLFAVYSIDQIQTALYWSRYLIEFPHFWGISGAFNLLFGPLLYLYVRSHIHNREVFSNKSLLHFFPFLIKLIYMLPLYFMSREDKIYVLENYTFAGEFNVDLQSLIIGGTETIHLVIYLTISILLIKKTFNRTVKISNGKSQRSLSIINKLLIGLGCCLALWYFYTITIFLNVPYSIVIDYSITFSAGFFVYAIGYVALRSSGSFTDSLTIFSKNKYEKSALSDELIEKYTKSLINSMELSSLYLDGDLTLNKLAKELKISSHNLSQIFNIHLRTNFFDFVNGYRIKTACAKLADPDYLNQTILSIALDSGFNNKTSFNTAFKKHTGQTPTEFKNSLRPL